MTQKKVAPSKKREREADLSRREFVGKTLAVAPALAMTKWGVLSEAQSTASTSLGPPFSEPREIRSVDGVLRAILRVRGGLHQVPDPTNPRETTELRLRTYDDEIPGPTLRARVGDRIRVTLENRINPAEFPPTSDTACRGHLYFFLIPIVVGLVRSVYVDVDVVGLFLGELGELGAELVEMQPRDFFVELLR